LSDRRRPHPPPRERCLKSSGGTLSQPEPRPQKNPFSLPLPQASSSSSTQPPPAWPGRAVAPPNHKARAPGDPPKRFSVLGSTGSIGTQTLGIAAEHADKFEIVALSAGGNIELLAQQTRQFKPSLVALQDASKVAEFKELIRGVSPQPEIVTGDEGAIAAAAHRDADAVVTGIVGCAGLQPTCAAIRAGKDICLANKETLIAGGPAVLPLAAKHGVKLLPADSEHSAIFQARFFFLSFFLSFFLRLFFSVLFFFLWSERAKEGASVGARAKSERERRDEEKKLTPPTSKKNPPKTKKPKTTFQVIQGLPEGGLRRVILTASGGAFRDLPAEELKNVTVADALKHPNWSMGPKITVDSATLMNKGLEVIEAHYLFGTAYDNIDVVIHPQSIIHSMVETADSSVLAQLG